jgi:hypothetical protein
MYAGRLSVQKYGSTFKQKTVVQNITFFPPRTLPAVIKNQPVFYENATLCRLMAGIMVVQGTLF